MLSLKFASSDRRLNFPIYSWSNKTKKQKSCFIDHDRIDTVRMAKELERGKKK